MNKYIIAGLFGGLLTIIIILLTFSIFSAYEYTPIQILNPLEVDHSLSYDKIALIKELSRNGTLLAPSEYTNHIISYYNSLIMLLVGLFAIFSFIGYFSLKSRLKEQIQESLIEMLRDSKEFDETISQNIIGRVTNGFVPYDVFQETSIEIADLRYKVSKMEEEPVKRKMKVSKK